MTTFSGVISGDGGLTKEGSGTLELSGENSYSGSSVKGGTLQVASSGAQSSATMLLDGRTLRLSVTPSTKVATFRLVRWWRDQCGFRAISHRG